MFNLNVKLIVTTKEKNIISFNYYKTMCSTLILSLFISGCAGTHVLQNDSVDKKELDNASKYKQVILDEKSKYLKYNKIDQTEGIVSIAISKDNKFYNIQKTSKQFTTIEQCQAGYNADLVFLNNTLKSYRIIKIEDNSIYKYKGTTYIINTKECSANSLNNYNYFIDVTQQGEENLHTIKVISEGLAEGTANILWITLVIITGAILVVVAIVMFPFALIGGLANKMSK